MIDIEKVRGHLGNLWGQTSMSDVGSKCELEKAITELERLQKKEEIYNYLFMVSVGYNLALVKNKDITEKQFYEIIKKHYENAITGSDGK